MTWNFRNRIELRPGSKLQYTGPEWVIEDRGNGRQVKLVGKFPRTFPILDPEAVAAAIALPSQIGPIADARSLVLTGSGYESETDAMSAGALWRGRLMRAFATLHIGANFGSDLLPSGGFTAYGFQQYMPGKRTMNDPHRLFAYEAEPEEPLFVVTNPVDAFVSSPHERLEEAMMSAADVDGLTGENQIAYGLYANSFGQGYEPRFALLMIAVECMIEPKLRSKACRAHVESMINVTRTSDLPERDINSLVGSLRYMLKQSISQAGQDLARQLEPNQYDNKDAVRFFKDCYGIRSRLVHGIHPLPTPEDLSRPSAELERFVGDLLSRS